jgi:hypothetical protein
MQRLLPFVFVFVFFKKKKKKKKHYVSRVDASVHLNGVVVVIDTFCIIALLNCLRSAAVRRYDDRRHVSQLGHRFRNRTHIQQTARIEIGNVRRCGRRWRVIVVDHHRRRRRFMPSRSLSSLTTLQNEKQMSKNNGQMEMK